MESTCADLISGARQKGKIWFLEHPPLYTKGTSAQDTDLLVKGQFPIYNTSRGGKFTYHEPGQRVVYLMLDLNMIQKDIRAYICHLESWIIATLEEFSIQGKRRKDRIGIWITDPHSQEKKIAAVGVRVRKWVSMHGIAINVNPDLSHFNAIVPCGIKEFGVTSMHALGQKTSLDELDQVLKKAGQFDYF